MKDRVFAGKKFIFVGHTPTKDKATHMSSYFRGKEKGVKYYARVIPDKYGYSVYIGHQRVKRKN